MPGTVFSFFKFCSASTRAHAACPALWSAFSSFVQILFRFSSFVMQADVEAGKDPSTWSQRSTRMGGLNSVLPAFLSVARPMHAASIQEEQAVVTSATFTVGSTLEPQRQRQRWSRHKHEPPTSGGHLSSSSAAAQTSAPYQPSSSSTAQRVPNPSDALPCPPADIALLPSSLLCAVCSLAGSV
jgi:hypothetical protein